MHAKSHDFLGQDLAQQGMRSAERLDVIDNGGCVLAKRVESGFDQRTLSRGELAVYSQARRQDAGQ